MCSDVCDTSHRTGPRGPICGHIKGNRVFEPLLLQIYHRSSRGADPCFHASVLTSHRNVPMSRLLPDQFLSGLVSICCWVDDFGSVRITAEPNDPLHEKLQKDGHTQEDIEANDDISLL